MAKNLIGIVIMLVELGIVDLMFSRQSKRLSKEYTKWNVIAYYVLLILLFICSICTIIFSFRTVLFIIFGD